MWAKYVLALVVPIYSPAAIGLIGGSLYWGFYALLFGEPKEASKIVFIALIVGSYTSVFFAASVLRNWEKLEKDDNPRDPFKFAQQQYNRLMLRSTGESTLMLGLILGWPLLLGSAVSGVIFLSSLPIQWSYMIALEGRLQTFLVFLLPAHIVLAGMLMVINWRVCVMR